MYTNLHIMQNTVIPRIENFIETALNVTPLTGPILLDRYV